MRPAEAARFQLGQSGGTYPGGKAGAGVAQKIINLMPPHRVYIEPFLGRGAVMLRKRPAEINIGIDADGAVISLWKQATLRELLSTGAVLGGAGLDVSRSPAPPDPASPPPMSLYHAAADPDAQNSDTRSPLQRRSNRRRSSACASGVTTRFDFKCADAISWLRWYNFTGDELVYCDPPYLPSTRRDLSLYQHEMTSAQHGELLSVLKELSCFVLVSGYQSPLYERALRLWHRIDYQTMTRRGPVTERLWFNFAPPLELHDYRYLGENRRERERIKRRITRWQGKLQRMDRLERQALLMAMGVSL